MAARSHNFLKRRASAGTTSPGRAAGSTHASKGASHGASSGVRGHDGLVAVARLGGITVAPARLGDREILEEVGNNLSGPDVPSAQLSGCREPARLDGGADPLPRSPYGEGNLGGVQESCGGSKENGGSGRGGTHCGPVRLYRLTCAAGTSSLKATTRADKAPVGTGSAALSLGRGGRRDPSFSL